MKHVYKQLYQVTLLQLLIIKMHLQEIKYYSVAPGGNKHPVSFLMDKKCEDLALLVLFPKGRYGYTTERKIKLTPNKYFNVQLLHRSGRFKPNPEYFFFCTVYQSGGYPFLDI